MGPKKPSFVEETSSGAADKTWLLLTPLQEVDHFLGVKWKTQLDFNLKVKV